MKIAVIGFSGSGKSTLAREIGREFHIPVLHLDRVHWVSGWRERPLEEKQAIVRRFLDSRKSWVIDGNYRKLDYERRLSEADRIIFMSFRRFTCLYRVWRRYWRYRGKTREDMGRGCKERLNLEFLWWILYEGRTRKKWMEYKAMMREYGKKVVVISNQRQLDSYKRGLMRKGK